MLRSLPAHIRDAIENATLNSGATSESLDHAATRLGIALPDDYRALMLETNGAEFYLGETCIILYAIEELLGQNEPDERFPAYLKCFGTNGGSERFAFDTRTEPHPIVVVPDYQPSEGDVLVQGTTLHAFLERVRQNAMFS